MLELEELKLLQAGFRYSFITALRSQACQLALSLSKTSRAENVDKSSSQVLEQSLIKLPLPMPTSTDIGTEILYLKKCKIKDLMKNLKDQNSLTMFSK